MCMKNTATMRHWHIKKKTLKKVQIQNSKINCKCMKDGFIYFVIAVLGVLHHHHDDSYTPTSNGSSDGAPKNGSEGTNINKLSASD